MLFALKKLIGAAIMPLSLVLLLQVLALLLWARKRNRAALGASALGVMLLALASNEGIADRLILRLERQHAPAYLDASGALPASLASCRAIAVFGGGHTTDPRQSALGRLSPSSLSRLIEAVRLSRLLPHAQLLLCGPVTDADPTSHAAMLARAAIELGVDSQRITLLPEGRDTHDEVHAILAVAGHEPVALVTSAWHMPRTMGLAQKAGLNARAAPPHFAIAPTGSTGRAWFKFSVFGLERSTKATREYVGLLWTRLRGQR